MLKKILLVLALLVIAGLVFLKLTTPEEFKKQKNPAPNAPMGMFDKSAVIFDAVTIYGTKGVPFEKLSHAAQVAAQWLDNDQNGQIDDDKLKETLIENKPAVIMSKDGFSNLAMMRIFSSMSDYSLQDLSAEETNNPTRRDASQEEIHHIIVNAGWQKILPSIFSDQASVNGKLYKIWKFADDNGHYYYDDPTCDDACKTIEFFYLATASYLDSQADLFSDEMRLKSKDALKETIPGIIEIIESDDYVYPVHMWPNGEYEYDENIEYFGANQRAIFNEELGIEAVPQSLGKEFTSNFNRYIKVIAPNGKPIHIVIQDDITQEQILRCRGILEHFLKDYPGSKHGADKSAIANKMADNEAVLALLNGQDDGKNKTNVPAQYLFKNEIQVEGHAWYTNQNFEHRDAAFEEILHFVHDNGIGVDGPNTRPGAAPEFQKVIRSAQVNGLANKLWADNERAKDWIKELDEENSLSQEYLASVIDTYYGLWGAWDGKSRRGETRDSDKGMWGLYVAKTRDQLKSRDPMAYELMDNNFFHPYLTYNARIDKDFSGTFSLKFDTSIPYTHQARYLKDITLLGGKNTNVRVNELDNDITGNAGKNAIIFSGNMDEYIVQREKGFTTVADNVKGRDGINVVKLVDKLHFLDRTIDL